MLKKLGLRHFEKREIFSAVFAKKIYIFCSLSLFYYYFFITDRIPLRNIISIFQIFSLAPNIGTEFASHRIDLCQFVYFICLLIYFIQFFLFFFPFLILHFCVDYTDNRGKRKEERGEWETKLLAVGN